MVSWDTRMLSSWDTGFFSQPEICFGDQSRLVYSPRCPATLLQGQQAKLGPPGRLPGSRCPLDWLDTRNSHHDVRPPGSRSTPLALNIWRSHGSIPSRSPSVSARSERRPDGGSNPTGTRHQATNGRMLLAKGAPDLMQRLPCFPTTPHVEFLLRRKPKPSSLFHKHHL